MRRLFSGNYVMKISLIVLVLFTLPPVSWSQNTPNGNCYTSQGIQYYMRAYAGNKVMDEIALCDEKIAAYQGVSSCGGVLYYSAKYHDIKAREWYSKQWKMVIIQKDGNGNVSIVCEF